MENEITELKNRIRVKKSKARFIKNIDLKTVEELNIKLSKLLWA